MDEKERIPKTGVGVMIFKGDKILLGKRRWRHGDGEYAFPGGHLDYLESIEDCARRETREEAGVEIEDIEFLCLANSLPYPPRHDVYIGVVARWKSGEPKSLERERMTDWGWYEIDSLPEPLFHFCNFSIEAYKTGKRYFDIEK